MKRCIIHVVIAAIIFLAAAWFVFVPLRNLLFNVCEAADDQQVNDLLVPCYLFIGFAILYYPMKILGGHTAILRRRLRRRILHNKKPS
jgi:heme/copper-type cytochrome/quinol oxidase subunit 1